MSYLASLASSGMSSKADIESLFNKILSPLRKEADPNLVAQFCLKLNNDFDGAQIAIDLITAKLHSNQEWEQLIVLYILEACVKNCGDRFHDLIGRFRFLNEMIKLVSPKYLGNRTSDKVKKRCIELLYSWCDGLPHKTKIKEAYDMLKKQGIVQTDPAYVEKLVINVAPRPKNQIFDDDSKTKQLAQLLKSKNPQDLELANRLIKNMVKQDELKVEKISARINELELMNNNIKLLNDMLLNYNPNITSDSEKETIKYLYEELQKLRPNLVKLANESEDNDDSISEIIKTNENCEKIMNQYKLTFLKELNDKVIDDVKLVNIMETDDDAFTGMNTNARSQIGSTSQNKNSTGNYDPLSELQDLFSNTIVPNKPAAIGQFNNQFTQFTGDNSSTVVTSNIENLLSSINVLPVTNASNNEQFKLNQNLNSKKPTATTPVAKTPQLRALDDLNELGRSLIEQSLNDPKVPLNAAVNNNNLIGSSMSQPNNTLSLNDLQKKNLTSNVTNINDNQSNANSESSFNTLNNLFIQLESIKPGSIAPFLLYDKNNLKITLYFGRESPAPDINVVVISVSSQNTQSQLKNFSFQAAVPKSMKVKLQPASRSDLPAYNPILPPSVITQVMLVANPKREQIKLKYKVSYSFDDVNYNEPDEVKTLPVLMDSLI